MKQNIQAYIEKALSAIGINGVPIIIDRPAVSSHGDYATNVAMIAAKKVGKSPMDLAEELKEKVLHVISNETGALKEDSKSLSAIAKVEVVAPGFINFWLSEEYLLAQLEKIKERVAINNPTYRGKKIMIEFTDPNPFKEFHIGHLYSNTVGESLARLLEASGATVRRVNYQGDVGLHVAKALWGITKKMNDLRLTMDDLEKKTLDERIKILGQAYAMGAKAYEDDSQAKEEINALNKQVYQHDPNIEKLYQVGRQWSLDYFEKMYERLGTKFEGYYFESTVGELGLALVKEFLKKNVFEESDGAVIFPGEKYGLHNRVFINSLGLPTYEAKELGLAPKKYEDFAYDLSIIVTGNEIIGYFKVILSALGQIRPDLASKTKHVAHGMVRLPEGKMSSRTGNVITGEWLLDEAKARIVKNFKDVDEKTAGIIAVAAVKYALLKSSIGKDISFDFDESISLEGNSGPYIQYTYARTQSVLDKVKKQNAKGKSGNAKVATEVNPEELALLRLVQQFPEVVEEASEKFAPNTIATYVFDLAQAFNLFYQKHKIIGTKEEAFRVFLVSKVGSILSSGLDLLGIAAPQKM